VGLVMKVAMQTDRDFVDVILLHKRRFFPGRTEKEHENPNSNLILKLRRDPNPLCALKLDLVSTICSKLYVQ
jgi:hypothetical protein